MRRYFTLMEPDGNIENAARQERYFPRYVLCYLCSYKIAKHGCRVTHFDLSQPMIDKAKEL